MKSKIISPHIAGCRANKKNNPWSGGTFREPALHRGEGFHMWFIWCCANTECQGQIAIRYDSMAEFINKMARTVRQK